MSLVLGTYNGISGGSISMVWSANTTQPAYFELSKTALFDINIVYNHGFSAVTSTINSRFFMVLYNITDGVEMARCFIILNNTTIPLANTGIINGLF